MKEPKRADADGLIECLGRALRLLGITNILNKASVLDGRPILIGGGTDGASVNVSEQNGMMGNYRKYATGCFGCGALHITCTMVVNSFQSHRSISGE